MRAAECDALLIRAQDGEPAAWTALALLMHRELEIIAALYAVDQAMVAAVCADCWPIAQQWLTEQRYPQRAKVGFMLGTPNESITVLQRLRDEALVALRQRLQEFDRAAIASRDAVCHLLAQSGLESLPRTGAEVPYVLPLINERLKRSSPSIQGLMIKRQRERMTVMQIAEIAGRPAGQVAHALCQARNTTDWHPGGALPIAANDGDFPLMIEEFIDVTLSAELHAGLAQILLGDLESTAAFVRQIRLDLVLTACLHPDPADATHLLKERAPTPGQGSVRRSTVAERPAPQPFQQDARPVATTSRSSKPKKSANAPGMGLWLALAGGAVVVVVIALVMLAPGKTPARPATTRDDPPAAPLTPSGKPAEPTTTGTKPAEPTTTTANDASIRVEAGQPTVRRDGTRQRLQPGGTLRGDDAFDSDASAGPVVLGLSGGRKLTMGVNSAIAGVQFGPGASDVVTLSRGYVRSEGPSGSRNVVVRAGGSSFVGEGATFSLTTLGSGQRVEVSRGSVQMQRGNSLIGTVLAGQVGALNDNGEVQVMSSGTFVLGINLGGPSVTLDDRRLKAQRHGEADGLTISGGSVVSAALPGEVSASLRPLLESGVTGNVRLSQTLPDGSYDVICWVSGRPGSTLGSLTVDGQGAADAAAAAGDSAALGANGWRRLWPRRCVVSGGRLTLNFSGTPDQRLAGVMIQTGGTDVSGKPTVKLPPTVFLDHPVDGLSVPAPATLTCKAYPYVPDGAISSIEFLVNGSKVGESKEPPYVFSWTGQTPGAHQLSARVVASNGLNATSAAVGLTIAPTGKIPEPPVQPVLPGEVFQVDDLERDAAGWEYVGGWEFPGAKGAAARDAGAARGRHAYRLDYDFTGGGAYVGVWKQLDTLQVPNVSEVRFWVKIHGTLSGVGIRLADGSDQVHQSYVPLQATSDWQEVVVKIATATGGEHWAGANDGKWHPSIKGLGVNVGKGNGATVGTVWFDDVSVLVATP